MDDLLPSYESAIQQDPWTLIAPYLPSDAICCAALVCKKWHEIFTPHLWGSPASHFGVENDTVYGKLICPCGRDAFADDQQLLSRASSVPCRMQEPLYVSLLTLCSFRQLMPRSMEVHTLNGYETALSGCLNFNASRSTACPFSIMHRF